MHSLELKLTEIFYLVLFDVDRAKNAIIKTFTGVHLARSNFFAVS